MFQSGSLANRGPGKVPRTLKPKPEALTQDSKALAVSDMWLAQLSSTPDAEAVPDMWLSQLSSTPDAEAAGCNLPRLESTSPRVPHIESFTRAASAPAAARATLQRTLSPDPFVIPLDKKEGVWG